MLRFYLATISLLIALSLTGCNLPGQVSEFLQGTRASLTPVTVISTLPPVTATQPSTHKTVVNISTATSTESFTPAASLVTVTASATLTGTSCDQAAPGIPLDITIPDDTQMLPGQVFTKTWRLVNFGNCAWTQFYALVYFSGSQMGAAANSNLPKEVAPGESIDVSLDMIAPANPGIYQGNWKLSNPEGHLYGIGPNGDSPFWVRIAVIAEATVTPTPTLAPTQTATPVVYITGQAILKPGDSLDLDTNTIISPPANPSPTPDKRASATPTISETPPAITSDLAYTVSAEKTHQLEPIGGAQFTLPGGPQQPTYQDCMAAKTNTNPLTLEGLALNSTFCYRTNLGLPGWARLVSLDPKTEVLTIEILTWAIP